MAESTPDPSSLLPLAPAHLHVLMALADGEKHGYAIMREVEAMTEGDVSMGPGTLYGAIKRMLKLGLIEESDERPDPELDDERRRYYEATGFGLRVLSAEAARLQQMVAVAKSKSVQPGTAFSPVIA